MLDVFLPVIPVIVIGGIAVFVILRMKHKYKIGTLIKMETQKGQNLVDSIIPIGMGIGTAAAILISLFFPISLLSAIGWGPGIGMLFGYVAYEIYSKKEGSYS